MERLTYYRGCLLGLAVGDAMGSAIDKKSWEEICDSYGPNGLLGYDLQNDYADITSYTQLAAFAANGLLLGATRGQAESYPNYMALALKEWAKAQQFRLGAERTHCWVAQVEPLRRRLCMDARMPEALSRETLGTPDSPINTALTPGALTTAVAVGLFYDSKRMDPRQIGHLGAGAVALTHGNPESFLSGAVLAYLIAGILSAPEQTLIRQLDRALRAVKELYEDRFGTAYDAVEELLRRAVVLTEDPELSGLAAMTLLGCTTAPECLAGAIYACLSCPKDFDQAMILSVNHSGRSAAVGAVAGSILGAYLGADALPEFYLESIEPTAALDELATDLALGRQTTRIFDDSWDQKYIQGLPVNN